MLSSSSLMKCMFFTSLVILLALLYFYQEKNACSSSSSPLPSIQSLRVHSQPVSCSCLVGATPLKDFVNKDKFDDIVRRRGEEYKQHQIREKSPPNKVLLAPANSPLQYPIKGFVVLPLQKSLIPGAIHLALPTEPFDNLYEVGIFVKKVTLSVSSGVLAVESLQEKDQVEGQGEKVLSISASSLESLNNLLGRVSYRSAVYSIKSEDLVHFTFEEYTTIFPIVIRQPTVPVLYDLGEGIKSQVTITTKTFLRYDQLNYLIRSIRRVYKDIKIIIADDSINPQKVNGSDIEQYFMPPAQGWFAGRNLAISQVTTKYFLWVDDDFEFTDRTRIERFVEIMEAVPELDVVGGSVGTNAFTFKVLYEEGDEEGGCLSKIPGNYQPIPGIPNCFYTSGVVNFFLARTDAIRRVGFDPLLKRVGHSEFFMDGLGKLLVASCPDLSIGHQPRRVDTDGEYYKYRMPPRSDTNSKLALHFFKNHLKCVKY